MAADTPDNRWILSGMQEDAVERGFPMPDEAEARQLCLGEEVEAPDLANLKDFFRFYIATSQERIDSINTFAQWFFAGFTCVMGTPIKEEDRKEIYRVCICPLELCGFNLTGTSGSK